MLPSRRPSKSCATTNAPPCTGESIIAQRAPAARAALARTWHQHILARLPGSTWRYCGCRREAVGYAWLFFEEAADERARER